MRKITPVSWLLFFAFFPALLNGCGQPAGEGDHPDMRLEQPLPYTTPTTMTIGAAGIPPYEGMHPDYKQIFAELAHAGITTFFPFFAYQEIPQPLTYGHETDFLSPCTVNGPAYQAMREYHIHLLIPGTLLYAQGFPPLASDPLKALIACAGRAQVAGVYSIDEPVNAEQSMPDAYQLVRTLYQRVKMIDPTLPVVMVQAPFVAKANGIFNSSTSSEIETYLNKVQQFNQYADVIGFDIYPLLPSSLPQQLVTPYHTDPGLDYRVILNDYLRWLHDHADSKPYMLVLQAFSFNWEEAQSGPERMPTAQELHTMACLAYHGGVSQLNWYGQSFQQKPEAGLWEKVLQVSKQLHIDAAHTCP